MALIFQSLRRLPLRCAGVTDVRGLTFADNYGNALTRKRPAINDGAENFSSPLKRAQILCVSASLREIFSRDLRKKALDLGKKIL